MSWHAGASVVGEAVRRHRLAAGLTQRELAGRAGISVRALRDLEHGRVRKPQARSVRGLADALGLAAAEREALLCALTGDDRRVAVGVLGPLVVSRGGLDVDIPSQRQRALLGLLALQHGQAVPVGEIIDVLWGEHPPRTARNLVQTYVSELRAMLGTAAVRRVAGGYVLESATPDLAEFDDRTAQAYRKRAAGESEQALELLIQALQCWRGGVLADAGSRLRQHPCAVAADQRRIAAAMALADLATALRRPAVAGEWLPAVCRAAPLHEGLHARWMVVLAGAGQQAAALRVYTDLRVRLTTELGVEPGEELQAVHLRVLRGEVTTTGDLSTVTTKPERRAVPAQLPAAASNFVGRAKQLHELDRLLGRDSAPAVVIASVAGAAGVGKTALAVHWAHRVRERFPDGQLYVDLYGYTQGMAPLGPGEALDRMLRALGVPGTQIPANLDERAAMYRTRLADARMLIVLDNAATEAQVAPLLPGAPGSLVLVTSRRRLAGLDHTHILSLDILPVPDAVTLLVKTAGDGRLIDQPPHLLVELVELCGRLPLAIRIAAARLRAHPTWHLSHLVERLRDQRHRLVELAAGQRSVTAALDLSYHHLDLEQQRMYRLLGLHPGPDLDPYAAAALLDSTPLHAAQMLDQLLDAHLLLEPVPGRYRFHDLTRAHAARTATRDQAEPTGLAAMSLLLDYYRHAASLAMAAAYPYERDRRPQVPPARTPTPDLSDPASALGWLDTELTNLLAAARYASEHGSPAHLLHLSNILHRHLYTRGRHHEAETLHRQALTTARATGHPEGELTALTGLGDAHRMQGRYEQAADHYQEALQIAGNAGRRGTGGELTALLGLGHLDWMQGRQEQATDHYQRALQLAQVTGDQPGELGAAIGLGRIHRIQGRFQQATDYLGQALRLARAIGHRGGELNVLIGIGHTHRLQSRYEQAADYLGQALRLARAIGDQAGELNVLIGLGEIHRRQRRHEQAAEDFQQILVLAQEIGDRNSELEAWQGLGRLRHATGDPATAITYHVQALALAAELDQRIDQARAHDGLAHAYHTLNQDEQARTHWQHALDMLTGLGIDHTDDEETTGAAIRAHLADLE